MSETSQDSPLSVQPGQVLDGKFRVDRVLGEGGMGVVVAATHVALGQRVAIKFMLPRALASADNVARFEREAKAVVRLRSEHVARVHDVGRLQTGAPYIVMEFLEGYDLDQLLESSGALSIENAVDYVLQACEAIAEAHSLGIVHRDLKPTNLFLTTRVTGKPLIKVLDFGISKSNAGDDLSLTSTSQIMGSPNYMSPEQLRSARNVDSRTDIWALGAILYELLTRQVPFVADSVTQLTAMVVTEAPRPILELRPEIPAALASAVMKCLEKKREERFQSVSEFAKAIAPFASVEGAMKAGDIASASGEHASIKLFPDGPSSSPRSSPAASTASAWDRTQLAPNSIRQRRASIAAAVFALSIVGIGAVVISKSSGKTVASPEGTASSQSPSTGATQNAIASASSTAVATTATLGAILPPENTASSTAIAVAHPPATHPASTSKPSSQHFTSTKPKPDPTNVTTSQPIATVAPVASSHAPELPNVRN
jgi:serine/threonine-protein kinase